MWHKKISFMYPAAAFALMMVPLAVVNTSSLRAAVRGEAISSCENEIATAFQAPR